MSPSHTKTCPICDKPANADYLPFCSKRCADVDLNRWLGETYRVPVAESEDEISEDAPVIDPANDR